METQTKVVGVPFILSVNLLVAMLLVAGLAGCSGDDSSGQSAPDAADIPAEGVSPVKKTYTAEEIQEQTKVGYILGCDSAEKVRLVLDGISDLPEGWARFSSMSASDAADAVLISTKLSPDYPPSVAPAGSAIKDGMTEQMIVGFKQGFADFWLGEPLKYNKDQVFADLQQKYGKTMPQWLIKK